MEKTKKTPVCFRSRLKANFVVVVAAGETLSTIRVFVNSHNKLLFTFEWNRHRNLLSRLTQPWLLLLPPRTWHQQILMTKLIVRIY